MDWVDAIIKVDTPEDGVPKVGTWSPETFHPLLVDMDKTYYLCRVSSDWVDIVLKPHFKAAANGDLMWSGASCWNDWENAEAAMSDKVILYEKIEIVEIDGKMQDVTISVSVKEAKATETVYDVTKKKVPVKVLGSDTVFEAKEVGLSPSPLEEKEVIK